MGSGVLLAALVVLWFVVLVPMVVTRGDAQDGRTVRADSGRTLQRRRATGPVVHAETERVAIDREALFTSGELKVDVHALRRRTLGGLVALAVVGYVLVLRKVARRERLAARRAARTAAREAMRTSRPIEVDAHETVAAVEVAHPSVPLAPVHEFPVGRRVMARTPAPAGWQQSAVVGLDDDDIGFADIDEYQPRRVANG